MAQTGEGLIQVPFGRVLETRNSPRYQWDNLLRGKESFVILQYTRSGEGVFELEGHPHPVPAGHAFVAILPEASRYYFPAGAREPWRFSWVNFYGELALELFGNLRDRGGPVFPLSGTPARLLQPLVARAAKRKWTDIYEASRACYHFYLEALRHLPRRRVGDPLEDAVSHFRTHYREPLRIKEVAARAEMSREHFTRLFTQRMDQGPAAFLRGIRLEAAARLLRTTDLPIAEVAFRGGWPSAAKLDLFFKRHYGLSPRKYRTGRKSLPKRN